MTPRFDFLPWFSPRLSVSLSRVLQGIGHVVRAVPGEVVYRSPELFSGKLMFVKRGFIVKAMMSPLHEDPLLVSLSGPGALCGAYEVLYVKDRMPRRHWCATSAELLCVHSELLLRICDQNPEWQKELRGYAASCAVSDRLAMVINQTAGLEERSAVFVLLVGLSTESGFLDSIDNPGVEWLSIPALPSRTSASHVLGASREQLGVVLRRFLAEDAIRLRAGRWWVKKSAFMPYWERLRPLIESSSVAP